MLNVLERVALLIRIFSGTRVAKGDLTSLSSELIIFHSLNVARLDDNMDGYIKEANLLKALSHPARLQILDLLAQGEACVCHLTTVLGQRQPYISQQLMTLREAGLVLDRRDGTIIYYRLADERLAEIVALARELLPALSLRACFPVLPTGAVEGCPCPRCSHAVEITRAACSDRVSQTPF